MNTLLWFILGAVAGAGGAGAIWLTARWVARRTRASAQSVASSAEAEPPLALPGPAPVVLVREPATTERIVDPPPPGPVADLLRLSERVVIQLARLGRLEPDAPAQRERTQQGLAEATSSNQSAVSKVLRRLVAAEVISEDRRHIVDSSQRMKAYALTRKGELLAREVARRRHVDLLPSRAPVTPAARVAPKSAPGRTAVPPP